jgi:imidazolonepropionase-like amidohydrolase
MTTQQPPTKKLKATVMLKQPQPPLILRATTEADHVSSPCTAIFADLIIVGPANMSPIKNGCVVIQNGKILNVIQQMEDEKEYNKWATKDSPYDAYHHSKYYVKVLMPGMWDVHTHFIGATSRTKPMSEQQWNHCFEDRAVKVGRDVSRLGQILNSGFTSVREVGGLGKHLKLLVKEGTCPGPMIYHANVPIHITGGHCDLPSDVPLSCYGSICTVQDADGDGALFGKGSDGTSDCLKSVRRNLRAGADVIKLCCSGGVMSQTSGLPTEPQFSPHEIKVSIQHALKKKTQARSSDLAMLWPERFFKLQNLHFNLSFSLIESK